MSLRNDMVHTRSLLHLALPEVVLAQPLITLEDPGAYHIPLATIAALLACLPWFVRLPAFTFVQGTVTI